MNLIDLSDVEQVALLDLAILAMYSDSHLAQVEDNRIHQLLVKFGCVEKSDRDTRYDAAITRISRRAKTVSDAWAYAVELAQTFSRDRRTLAVETIETIIDSDQRVAPQEGEYLKAVREALKG